MATNIALIVCPMHARFGHSHKRHPVGWVRPNRQDKVEKATSWKLMAATSLVQRVFNVMAYVVLGRR